MATNGARHERSALILYGTETGNAQDVAEDLARSLERLHFVTNVIGMDTVTANELSLYQICLFVVSTTGQGDFPSNARQFWTSLLRKKLPNDFLAEVNFALVGIGDTSYPKFNWAARKLGKRLKQLGALEVVEACEADEQSDEGTSGGVLAWSQVFLSSLAARHPLKAGQQAIPNNVPLPSKWRLHQLNIIDGSNEAGSKVPVTYKSTTDPAAQSQSSSSSSFRATLTMNERVTPPGHWQDVRFLTLTTQQNLDYQPGDALAILPRNSPDDVNAMVLQMGWVEEADQHLQLEATSPVAATFTQSSRPTAWPLDQRNPTLRDLLAQYLDITAIPRRSFFSKIADYTNNVSHKERLLEFTDPEYLDEYYDYATRPRRSMLEVLQEFDSVKIPWQEAINVFPALRPRQFSIASGGALRRSPNGGTAFELLVAVVKYRTVIKKIREGVCTRYLAALSVGHSLDIVWRTEGRFAQRSDLQHPHHILIGAGTGIAPLRSLIYAKLGSNEAKIGATLIFGSRSATADFFFEREWAVLSAPPTQNSLHVITAFSRDQKEKVYVQDRIREHANMIRENICDRGASIVVCGSSGQMPKAVREALVGVLCSPGGGDLHSDYPNTKQEAETYLGLMEKRGRYKQETW